MLLSIENQNLQAPKSLQVKQEDKSFGRLLSKEQNVENNNHERGGEASFRVMYYGGAAGSIPFHWESRPGTPKHTLFSNTCSLPPLTPPPSYQQSPKMNSSKSLQKGAHFSTFSSSKSKLLHTLFSKFATSSRNRNSTANSSSTYSVSSSGSNSSSSYSFTSRKNSAPRSKSPIYFGLEDDNNDNEDDDDNVLQEQEVTRSRSRHRQSLTLCFGSRNNGGGACIRSRARRHLEVKSLRKGFLSIFATHHTA